MEVNGTCFHIRMVRSRCWAGNFLRPHHESMIEVGFDQSLSHWTIVTLVSTLFPLSLARELITINRNNKLIWWLWWIFERENHVFKLFIVLVRVTAEHLLQNSKEFLEIQVNNTTAKMGSLMMNRRKKVMTELKWSKLGDAMCSQRGLAPQITVYTIAVQSKPRCCMHTKCQRMEPVLR